MLNVHEMDSGMIVFPEIIQGNSRPLCLTHPRISLQGRGGYCLREACGASQGSVGRTFCSISTEDGCFRSEMFVPPNNLPLVYLLGNEGIQVTQVTEPGAQTSALGCSEQNVVGSLMALSAARVGGSGKTGWPGCWKQAGLLKILLNTKFRNQPPKCKAEPVSCV